MHSVRVIWAWFKDITNQPKSKEPIMQKTTLSFDINYNFTSEWMLLSQKLINNWPVNVDILSQISGENKNWTSCMSEIPEWRQLAKSISSSKNQIQPVQISYTHLIDKLDHLRFPIPKLPPFRFIPLPSPEIQQMWMRKLELCMLFLIFQRNMKNSTYCKKWMSECECASWYLSEK